MKSVIFFDFVKETFANAICKDKMDCSEVTQNICKKFPVIERDCPATCKICVCQDQKECLGITSNMCDLYSEIKDGCHKTCGICIDHAGNS